MEKILAIDDSKSVLASLKDILQKGGYECATAIDGNSGLIMARGFHPDVVLVDAEMPGISGFEVCANLKSDPTTVEIPVVFLSGHNDLDHRVRAFEAGAQDFIAKPFHEKEVLLRIETQLKVLNTQRELQVAKNIATEANRAKSVFLSRMSHELKTPLNSIIGYARHLHSDPSLVGKTGEQLGIILGSGEQLLDMVDELIQFSEMEAGQTNACPIDVDLPMLIRETCSDYKQQYQSLVKKFEWSIDEKIPGVAHLDPVLFRMLLHNLLRSNRCEPSIGALDLKVQKGDFNHIRIILEMHAQKEDSEYDAGLELAIVKKIVAYFGGEISRKTGTEGGVVVTTTLPIEEIVSSPSVPLAQSNGYALWIRDNGKNTMPSSEIPELQAPFKQEQLLAALRPGVNRILIDASLADQDIIQPHKLRNEIRQGMTVEIDVLLENATPAQELSLYHKGFQNCIDGAYLKKALKLEVVGSKSMSKVPIEFLRSLSVEAKEEIRLAARALDVAQLEAIAEKMNSAEFALWIKECTATYSFDQIEQAMEVHQ